MKFFIVGQQCCNKERIAALFEDAGIQVGHTFISIDDDGTFYTCRSVKYDNDTIRNIFELGAYKFFMENTAAACNHVEGLDASEYDSCDVFILTPTQYLNLTNIDDCEHVVVFLDDTFSIRRNVHSAENRSYNFYDEERYEHDAAVEFVEKMSDIKNLLYFSSEEPSRVFAIVYTLIKHPELLDLYKLCFN